MVDKKLSEFTEASEEEVSYFPVLDSSTKNRKLPAKVLTGIKTNCITEIPQDIKLELSSGTLTLKAGSKSYMPNGAGVFTEVTNSADLTYTPTWGAGYQCFITAIVNSSGNINGIGMCREDLQFSGTTQPSTTTNGSLWYDTSNNKIKAYQNGSWQAENRTLFLGIVTVGVGNVITSIDQVFNGFGYFGSTVFALPGVKGLIPNGRNDDGTLKNTSIALTSVRTQTYTNETANDVWFNLQSSQIGGLTGGFYDEQNNYLIKKSNGNIQQGFVFATGDLNSGKIINWKQNTVFHAVDYSDLFNEDHIYNGKNFFAGNRTQGIATQTTEYAYTDTPATSGGVMSYEILDKNGVWLAILGAEMYKNGDNAVKIQVKGKTGATAALRVFVKSDGSDYFTCTSGIKKSINEFGIPDYSSGVGITGGASISYTAPSNGIVMMTIKGGTVTNVTSLTVNNVEIPRTYAATSGEYFALINIPLKKGDILKGTSNTSGIFYSRMFFPYIGG